MYSNMFVSVCRRKLSSSEVLEGNFLSRTKLHPQGYECACNLEEKKAEVMAASVKKNKINLDR